MLAYWLDSSFLGFYIACGPVAWTWALTTIPIEQRRMRRDELLRQPLPDPAPRVSVIIPAKDEEKGIRACVASVLGQNYPNLSVIVVDHRSTDRTGAILDEMAAVDSRLKIVHFVGDMPAGWTGKNHAVNEGYMHADGEYLLFLDADCTLEPHTLRSMIGALVHKRVDLVSLMPRLNTKNAWERIIGPFAGLISSMLDRGLREPYAYGWFLLFQRESYERVGGHAAVRHVLDDDKQLALRIKQFGGRTRVWWGGDLAALTLDRPRAEIVRGLARNFYTMSKGRPWRLLVCLAFVLICCASTYAALGFGLVRVLLHPGSAMAWLWLSAGIIHWTTMTGAIVLIYSYGRLPKINAIALPLTLLMSITIFIRALWMCLTGKVTWHDVSYLPKMKPIK